MKRCKNLMGVLAMLALTLFAQHANAAIVLDARSVTTGSGVTFTFPHTVGVGTDRVLIVGVSIFNATKTVTGLTYAGQPLTRIGFLDGGTGSNDRRVEMWRLVNPPIGTANVVVSMSSSSKTVVGAASFFGVDAVAPHGPFVSNEASTNLATVTVPSAAGELVIDCLSVQGNAAPVVVGPGQAQLWNDFTRAVGGAVLGAASTEPGAPSVTMTWGLASTQYWVMGAVALKPVIRPYQPDAMVKLSSEADAAYFYDAYYENPAVLQVKNASVAATVTASYRVRFQNDGLSTDAFVITGTGSSAAFAVQYLDGAGVDRTAAVIASGYTDATLIPGASTTWTLNVTPLASGSPGGLTYAVSVTATSSGNPLRADQVRTQTTCVAPNLVMVKSADLATAAPGQDVAYSIVATASGLANATSIVVVDSIPSEVGLRVGSTSFNPGTTSLIATVSYSNDGGATWTYIPASGACAAPAGYDYCVTHVRWTLAGVIQPSQSFTLGVAVRVK